MFEHVQIAVDDLERSADFYTLVLATIGVRAGPDGTSWREFSLMQADDDVGPPTRGLHVGFGAPSRAYVEAFWLAGTAAGYRSAGEPGPRPHYTPDYYGAFLLDPAGNSIEAVHRPGMRTDGAVDHLWLRVAELAASRRFYHGIAGRAGLRVKTDERDHTQFVGATGSMSVVPGTPTENVRLGFASTGPDVLRDPDGNVIALVRP